MDLESRFIGTQRPNKERPLVLAVEDDEDSLVLLTQVLDLFNCTPITAKDGQTAIALAHRYQPHLILMDIVLPGLSGMEVIRRLKHDPETNHIPVVAVTALANTQERQQILDAGCEMCISKPYFLDDLEALINHYVSCQFSFSWAG